MSSAAGSSSAAACSLQAASAWGRHPGRHSRALPPHLAAAEGRGVVLDPHTVEVRAADGGVRQLRAKHILVATGGRAVKPNIPGAVSCLGRQRGFEGGLLSVLCGCWVPERRCWLAAILPVCSLLVHRSWASRATRRSCWTTSPRGGTPSWWWVLATSPSSLQVGQSVSLTASLTHSLTAHSFGAVELGPVPAVACPACARRAPPSTAAGIFRGLGYEVHLVVRGPGVLRG